MSRVGEKIKNLRNTKGMSQKQFAKKLGVSETFVNEVETGRKIANQSFIDRAAKVLGENINDITMSFEEEVYKEEKVQKFNAKPKKQEVNDVWNEAFGSVLKSVPIYKFDLSNVVGKKQLPLVNNKIEGYAQDKVFYLQIENDDMIGFRIAEGDIALVHTTHEFENNGICLVEYGNTRAIRQVKKLDSNKVLLVSNKGSLKTETIELRELKILARLDRVEIKL